MPHPPRSAPVHIRAASTVIAWDSSHGRHVYRRDCDLLFDSTGILHVGPGCPVPADARQLDGAGLLVMPGLISSHCHLGGGAYSTGLLEEVTDPQFQHSPLYTRKSRFWRSDVASPHAHGGRWYRAGVQHGVASLLASGVTSVVDIQGVMDDPSAWIDTLAGSGIRAWLAPSFQAAQWRTPDALRLEHAWDEAEGERQFAVARAIIEAVHGQHDARLQGMVFPAQVDTCDAALLQASWRWAREQDLVWQTHAAQSVPEVRTMLGRHGMTPVAWLDRLGVLDQDTILGHALFLDHHSHIRHHTCTDLDTLARRGVHVAHCPLTFSRWGAGLEDLGRYRRAGVGLTLGNDTGPQNMLEEMRCAFTTARLLSPAPAAVELADVFHAATVGGAAALGRDDLGRISVGARADLVLVDLDHPAMQPHRDPLRALVFVAADRAVREVYVDGEPVYAGGRPTRFDAAAAAAELDAGLARMVDDVRDLADAPPLDEVVQPCLAWQD